MMLAGYNRSTLEKLVPGPGFPLQIPYGMIWDLNRASEATERRQFTCTISRQSSSSGLRNPRSKSSVFVCIKTFLTICHFIFKVSKKKILCSCEKRQTDFTGKTTQNIQY
jgi:hypothetical protein